MSRDIKFRAWDTKYKRMVKAFWIGSLAGQIAVVTHQTSMTAEIQLQEFENYILMQFTGLKDKNGKEIYEGDIVEYKTHSSDELHTAEIKYLDGAFCIKKVGQLPLWNFTDLEVIGNIHEEKTND